MTFAFHQQRLSADVCVEAPSQCLVPRVRGSSVLVTLWHRAGDEAFSSSLNAWSFPFSVPHFSTLATPLAPDCWYLLLGNFKTTELS